MNRAYLAAGLGLVSIVTGFAFHHYRTERLDFETRHPEVLQVIFSNRTKTAEEKLLCEQRRSYLDPENWSILASIASGAASIYTAVYAFGDRNRKTNAWRSN